MTGADSSAGPDAPPGRRWDVALSFAGAQRDYVEQVAQALQARGVRCFYDADEQIELWGKYLAEELPAIYAERAAAVVVFVSAEYAGRDWTRLERRAALDRAVRERREYVLPARFDDTPLPGLLSGTVAVDLRGRAPQQFADMVVGKLAALGAVGLAALGAVGLAAYYHPDDDKHHVFASLASGDVWEARFASAGTAVPEIWLGKLDGGATCMAGYSSADGSQHLFVAGTDGLVHPLEIAPPAYQWRWGDPVTRQHDHPAVQ